MTQYSKYIGITLHYTAAINKHNNFYYKVRLVDIPQL